MFHFSIENENPLFRLSTAEFKEELEGSTQFCDNSSFFLIMAFILIELPQY